MRDFDHNGLLLAEYQGKLFEKSNDMPDHKIAVISDTHSLLRPEIKEKIKECELIIHAGDIASKETVEKIERLGPVYFVRGNADKGSWTDGIPVSMELELWD